LTKDYYSLEDVLKRYPVSIIGDKVLLCEIEESTGGQYRRRDKLLGTPVRTFGDRRIKILTVEHPGEVTL
jgi:hypothetical protein